ncbi:MAG: FlgD immunoglobulin-like domain containing protein [bacterium]
MNSVFSFWRCYFIVGVLLLLAVIVSADNGRGLHKKAYAVPVPAGKKVKIDGKLNDWDLSGQIHSYVVSETADTQGARFAMMYDKDALYLSGVVADTSPMMNRNDPKVNGNKGWDADACQFRMILDPAQGYPVNQSTWNAVDNDQMAHLILWYYTDRKEPCLQLHKGMTYKPITGTEPFGVLPHDKFQAAYLLNKNGREYTFEYRIPWKSLETKNIPEAGDLVAGTVQFNWGTADGLKTAGGSAWCYDVMSGPGFTFQSSGCWGKIIFSKTGNLPKDLVEDGLPPEKPLPLKFEYNIPEDSQVSVQLFNEKNEMVRTIVAQGDRRAGKMIDRWDGLDEVGKPLPAGTYQWKGLYHQPITTKFLFSAHNSGQPPYPTDDNKGGWGGDHGTPTTSCALPDGMLLAWNSCELGWGIIRTDLNGKKQWGSKHCSRYLATDGKRFFGSGDEGFEQHAGVAVYDAADSRPLNFGNGKPIADLPTGGDDKTNSVTGIAYIDGKLYVAISARNMIAVNDAVMGTLKETINVNNPGALAVAKDGSLLIVSDETILRLKDGKTDTFIKEKIDKPFAVTTDAEGNIYISNRGSLQNISVFSADGKYLRSIGKTGGRPAKGKYEKDGMLEPGGLSVDAKANIWVAETLDSPKRFSVWNSKDGSLANEFFGGSAYFGWLWMDPKHPDEIYCHNTVWKVDWTKNTCYPTSTMWRSTKPNMIGAVAADGYAGHVRVMTAKNGKQFAWGMRDYSNMLYMRSGDVFKPISGVIRVAFGTFGGGMPYPAMKDIYEKTKAGAFLWQDANDDQEIQPEELVVSPSGRGETAFNWIDADLNAWCDAGWIYKPAKITDDGRPIYDFSQKTDIPFKGSNANATSLWLDDKDDTVYTLNPGSNPGLAHWTRDGKMLWGYPNILPWPSSLNLPMVTPGKLHGLTMPLCVAGDFTGAVTYYNPYHILTRDGLYVAMITRDGRDGKGLGPDVIATESVQGQLVKPEGMNRYFLLAGAQDGRVTEIFGLDTVKRLPGGTYIHTEEDVKQTMQAQLEYQKALSNTKKLEIVRGLKSLDSASSVEKFVDATRSFSVKAAYDEKNLYVSYDVSSQFALINAEPDLRVIFKSGNLLDIQMATDPTADAKRKTPAPGDLRILISRQAGKTIAVIYRPKIKGFTGTPVVLSSPTGKESFDAIDISDKINLNYKPKNGGFEAFVTIPLETIGWAPQPSTQVKIDFGYIFGNATGTQASLRAYWTNNSPTSNILKDVPSECKLEPAEWGDARVE